MPQGCQCNSCSVETSVRIPIPIEIQRQIVCRDIRYDADTAKWHIPLSRLSGNRSRFHLNYSSPSGRPQIALFTGRERDPVYGCHFALNIGRL